MHRKFQSEKNPSHELYGKCELSTFNLDFSFVQKSLPIEKPLPNDALVPGQQNAESSRKRDEEAWKVRFQFRCRPRRGGSRAGQTGLLPEVANFKGDISNEFGKSGHNGHFFSYKMSGASYPKGGHGESISIFVRGGKTARAGSGPWYLTSANSPRVVSEVSALSKELTLLHLKLQLEPSSLCNVVIIIFIVCFDPKNVIKISVGR
ncbi:hypothetical protein TNCV_4973381 [Trichonephila clavipes]|uniref:Uncharacterized protein n=1 Tax=Trichonephila clavipes TaxID=2585209 RepID=A0A8X6SRU7_TRICX|nr:hypothetical protein TNCV_4973381 [Trichonephila clavipes]